MARGLLRSVPNYLQGIAVGSETFVEKVGGSLGFRAKGRKIISADDLFELREMQTKHGKAQIPDPDNTFLWDQ